MPPRSVEQLQAQLAERDKRLEELERERDELRTFNQKLAADHYFARAETAERERDNWHASNYAERQARLKAERDLASSQEAALLLHKRVEELERIRDSVVSKTALDVVAEKMAAEDRVEAAEQRVEKLEAALAAAIAEVEGWGPQSMSSTRLREHMTAALAARTEEMHPTDVAMLKQQLRDPQPPLARDPEWPLVEEC